MEAVHKPKSYKKSSNRSEHESRAPSGKTEVRYSAISSRADSDLDEYSEKESLLKAAEIARVHDGTSKYSPKIDDTLNMKQLDGAIKDITPSVPIIPTDYTLDIGIGDIPKTYTEPEQDITVAPAKQRGIEEYDCEYEQLSNFFVSLAETVPFTNNQLLSIYRNEELEANTLFVNQFIDEELRGGAVLRHPLYDMLLKYLRAREKQAVSLAEIESMVNESEEVQQRLWLLEMASYTEMGECQDGNPVSASHEYQIGSLDRKMLGELGKGLAAIREQISEQHALYTYTSQVCKLRIDHFIYETCYKFSNLPYNAPISLVHDQMGHQTSELRSALSVLFHFQRRLCKDQGFISDTKQWLSKLVAVLLRVATWQDHMFLLNHVLRCPSGINKWAVNYVQPPPSPFNSTNSSYYLNHILATLATIISPVKDRELFMAIFEKKEGANEEMWVMVDSDGEDEESTNVHIKLRESDIISLLNQVPFDYLFRQILQFSRRDDVDIYTTLSSSQILRSFAMIRLLIQILGSGLMSYDSDRHQQFIKRLASLVHHSAHYATDIWEAFKRDNSECHDTSLLERLQVEYDYIIYNACHCLLATKHKSTTQFVAVLPYSSVTLSMLWRLFHMILQPNIDNPSTCMNAVQWWDGVEKLVTSSTEPELYYLLTAASNMAMARSLDDYLFVKMVTSHLLQIGFLNIMTREISYKTVRTLLGNLCNKYPDLISVILNKFDRTVSEAGNLSLYLFKELPLDMWIPTSEDMDILENWLLVFPFGSFEGTIARYILSNMQWGPNPESEGELFLKRGLHVRVALLIVRLAILHCSESPYTSSTAAITECVRQFATSISRGQSSEQTVSIWAWQLLFKLHLHLMDQPDNNVWAVLNNPSVHFSALPSIESPANELQHLVAALKDKQVTAIYVTLSMTSEGHSVPLICNNGFNMMINLVNCHRYFAVLVLLEHIVPLFLDCPQSLLSSLRFQDVITSLITADKTFLKLAKNLITSGFPGIILKQFGDMIQMHLENYRKFNLQSPSALAQLWLEVLCKVWPSEPTSTAYLMDIVLRVAFLRPEIKNCCSDILSQLLQTGPAMIRPKFSLSSWMLPNTPVMSLMPRTVPDTPWFALFALELEQYFIQTKNGLWKQLLLELSSTRNKTSIDTALKKACNSLKLGVISSSSLPIYRWAQQALETPVDHPALPLLWQKFFTLYLVRVPSDKDLGCVGSKFFEGMSNHNFLKKLKKKIKDCKEYYESKCANSALQPTSDKKQWFDKVVKLYTSFGLWLEEPRIQESGIFLPALPPQYDTLKLNSIFQGDENPWYEYIDYEVVRKQQKENVLNWEHNLSRKMDHAVRHSVPQPEVDPVVRIVKRLQSYDSPLPAPTLRMPQRVIPHLSHDILHNKNLMLDCLKDSFRLLLNFAETFNLYMAEHTNLDCVLMEILPLLYRSVETEVKLYAACDTQNPRSRSPSPDSITCAGPAVIRLKICELRVSEMTDVAIHNNRTEMRTGLKRALQPPPMTVSSGSVHIEYVVRFLEHEWQELNKIGDVQLMSSLQDVGVALFYYMTSVFTEQVAAYPPLKQLITTCVESLGMSFISGDERQAGILLSTILETPSLSSLLATHFTPVTASPPMYIYLYKMLLNASSSVSRDFIFVLLTKFEMGQWLESQKPRMSEHSQLIELVGIALAKIGQNPPQDSLMIHEVLRRHLGVLMMNDAPQHYSEVITEVLKHTESHSIASDIWYDIINAIAFYSGAKFRPHMSLAQVVAETSKFATEQTILSLHELYELSTHLTNHFAKERLQYGLYGLYPKYRTYVSPFTSLLSILGHAVIVTTIKSHGNILPSKVCEQVWPIVSGLYSPWLCPYFTQSLTQPTAAWIQQLTDDRSVLLPWITGDAGHAHKMTAIFTETIRFLIEMIPGTGEIFSYLWQYYVTNFAHSSVKEHILSVIHSNFLSLPWTKFFPSLNDLDLMLKVSDSYVPYSHTFLGAVFIDVKWMSWIQKITGDVSINTRVHNSLLHLFIKLANEPNVRQSGKIVPLLEDAKAFRWDLVDCTVYESVVNWFVMSYDPRVVLKLEEEGNFIDSSVLELLKVAGGFMAGSNNYHASTSRKRQVFVRAYTKLLISSLSRHKNLMSSYRSKVEDAIYDMLTQIDFIITNTGGNYSEAGLLIAEFLALMNLPEGSSLNSVTLSTLLKWINTKGNCIVISALLRTLGTTIANNQILGTLMEASLTAYFSNGNDADWNSAKSLLQEVVPRHPPLEETLINNSQLLSLYALLIKQIPTSDDLREEANTLNSLIDCVSTIKPSEAVESKLVLFLHLGLLLSSRQCDHNTGVVNSLMKLNEVANSWAEYRSSWGILGAIGIRKQVTLSNRCKLLCRTLSLIVLSQLPEHKGELSIDHVQFIRTHPHAPGGLTCNNMELGPGAETIKSLGQLEGMVADKNFSDVRHAAEHALRLIKQPENSMHNAHSIFLEIATQLYSERYIQALKNN